MATLMLTLLAAFAEFERALLRERRLKARDTSMMEKADFRKSPNGKKRKFVE